MSPNCIKNHLPYLIYPMPEDKKRKVISFIIPLIDWCLMKKKINMNFEVRNKSSWSIVITKKAVRTKSDIRWYLVTKIWKPAIATNTAATGTSACWECTRSNCSTVDPNLICSNNHLSNESGSGMASICICCWGDILLRRRGLSWWRARRDGKGRTREGWENRSIYSIQIMVKVTMTQPGNNRVRSLVYQSPNSNRDSKSLAKAFIYALFFPSSPL
jgi:hypothetical protein